MGLHPAVAAVRLGVRRSLAELATDSTVLVACSGGADSLALLSAGYLAGRFREVLTTDGIFSGWGVRGDTLWAITPDGAPGMDRARERVETILRAYGSDASYSDVVRLAIIRRQ